LSIGLISALPDPSLDDDDDDPEDAPVIIKGELLSHTIIRERHRGGGLLHRFRRARETISPRDWHLVALGDHKTRRPCLCSSRPLVALDEGKNFGDEIGWDRHHRNVLAFQRGFDLRGLLLFRLVLVVRDHLADPLLMHPRGNFCLFIDLSSAAGVGTPSEIPWL
jgi:hypothetical protein